MRKDTVLTKAGQQYAAANAAHYTTKDLREALKLYKGVMPRTQKLRRLSTPDRRS